MINKQLVSLSDYPTIDVSSIDDVKHKLRIFWNSNTDNGTLKVKLKLYGFHENTDHIARNAESTSSIPWDFVTRHTLTITKKAGDKHTDSDDFRVVGRLRNIDASDKSSIANNIEKESALTENLFSPRPILTHARTNTCTYARTAG